MFGDQGISVDTGYRLPMSMAATYSIHYRTCLGMSWRRDNGHPVQVARVEKGHGTLDACKDA